MENCETSSWNSSRFLVVSALRTCCTHHWHHHVHAHDWYAACSCAISLHAWMTNKPPGPTRITDTPIAQADTRTTGTQTDTRTTHTCISNKKNASPLQIRSHPSYEGDRVCLLVMRSRWTETGDTNINVQYTTCSFSSIASLVWGGFGQ